MSTKYVLHGVSAQAWDSDTGLSFCGRNGGFTITSKYNVVPHAFTLTNLRVVLSVAPTVGNSWVITVYKNGVATTLTCTIADNATTGSDLVNSVSFVAGDTIAIFFDEVNACATTFFYFSAEATPVVDGEQALLMNTTSSDWFADDGGTQYNGLVYMSAGPVASDTYQVIVPCSGTIKSMYATLTAAPGNTKGRTFTVLKNGADTTLTCAINNLATTGNDTANSFTVAAGDKLSIKMVNTSTPTASRGSVAVVFLPDTLGNFITGTFPATRLVSRNAPLSGTTVDIAGEFPVPLPACTAKTIYGESVPAPGGVTSWTFALRKNAVDTALSVAVVGAATINNASVDVAIAADDLVSVSVTESGATTNGALDHAVLFYIAPTGVGQYMTPNMRIW